MRSLILLFIAISGFSFGCTSKYSQLYMQKPGFYSYIVSDVSDNTIKVEYNSKVYATPASCQKVVTTLIALKALGSDYKYKTDLYVTKKGKKIDDIVIAFSGDPTLTSDSLTSLLRPLQNTEISGHIVLDASIFKTPPYSPYWAIGDIGTDYAAPVSAINVDQNFIVVTVSPGQIEQQAQVKAEDGYRIKSDVVTGCEKTSVQLSWVDDFIYVKGNINLSDEPLELKISPQQYEQHVFKKIRKVLRSLNIKGSIKIVKDQEYMHKNPMHVNRVTSLSIAEIIVPALKKSDNFVFDSIYLSTIYSIDKEIETWEQGHDVIKSLASQHFAIDIADSLFIDGSGLSRRNRLQPAILLEFLQKGFYVFEFMTALPMPGEIGTTLEDHRGLSRNIKAKTGNLAGISCLCGYGLSHQSKAFVLMVNGFSPPSAEMFVLMDRLVSEEVG